MHVCSPLDLEKKLQPSCQVDIVISGFLSRCHRAVTPPSAFESVLGVTVESVAGESDVSGVHWDIRDLLKLPQESQVSMRVAMGL